MKPCFKCGRVQRLSEFYRHSQMADGHLGKCKRCTKQDVRTHRALHLEDIRAYDRERAKLPHRKALNQKHVQIEREQYPNRNGARLRAERHHRKSPGACQMCGLSKRLERHHPDYQLPLLIVWLCKPCHSIADARRREMESAGT